MGTGKKIAVIAGCVVAFGGIVANTTMTIVEHNRVQEQLKQLVDSTKTADSKTKAELTKLVADTRKDIQDAYAAADSKLSNSIATTKASIDVVKAELGRAIEKAKSDTQKEIDDAREDLGGKIDDAKEDLEDQIGEAKDDVESDLEAAVWDLEAADAEILATMTVELGNLLDEIEALADLTSTEDATIKANIAEKYGQIVDALDTHEETLADLSEKYEGVSALEAAHFAELKAEIQEVVSNYALLSAVNSAVNQLQNGLDTLEGKIAACYTKDEVDNIKSALKTGYEKMVGELEVAVLAGDATLAQQLADLSDEIAAIGLNVSGLTTAWSDFNGEQSQKLKAAHVVALNVKFNGFRSEFEDKCDDVKAAGWYVGDVKTEADTLMSDVNDYINKDMQTWVSEGTTYIILAEDMEAADAAYNNYKDKINNVLNELSFFIAKQNAIAVVKADAGLSDEEEAKFVALLENIKYDRNTMNAKTAAEAKEAYEDLLDKLDINEAKATKYSALKAWGLEIKGKYDAFSTDETRKVLTSDQAAYFAGTIADIIDVDDFIADVTDVETTEEIDDVVDFDKDQVTLEDYKGTEYCKLVVAATTAKEHIDAIAVDETNTLFNSEFITTQKTTLKGRVDTEVLFNTYKTAVESIVINPAEDGCTLDTCKAAVDENNVAVKLRSDIVIWTADAYFNIAKDNRSAQDAIAALNTGNYVTQVKAFNAKENAVAGDLATLDAARNVEGEEFITEKAFIDYVAGIKAELDDVVDVAEIDLGMYTNRLSKISDINKDETIYATTAQKTYFRNAVDSVYKNYGALTGSPLTYREGMNSELAAQNATAAAVDTAEIMSGYNALKEVSKNAKELGEKVDLYETTVRDAFVLLYNNENTEHYNVGEIHGDGYAVNNDPKFVKKIDDLKNECKYVIGATPSSESDYAKDMENFRKFISGLETKEEMDVRLDNFKIEMDKINGEMIIAYTDLEFDYCEELKAAALVEINELYADLKESAYDANTISKLDLVYNQYIKSFAPADDSGVIASSSLAASKDVPGAKQAAIDKLTEIRDNDVIYSYVANDEDGEIVVEADIKLIKTFHVTHNLTLNLKGHIKADISFSGSALISVADGIEVTIFGTGSIEAPAGDVVCVELNGDGSGDGDSYVSIENGSFVGNASVGAFKLNGKSVLYISGADVVVSNNDGAGVDATNFTVGADAVLIIEAGSYSATPSDYVDETNFNVTLVGNYYVVTAK